MTDSCCCKEDIQAELKDGYLTINASHQEDNEEKDKKGKYIRKERYYGQCRRSYFVGKHITQDDIHAKFENGILKLEIPKKKESPEIIPDRYYPNPEARNMAQFLFENPEYKVLFDASRKVKPEDI